MRTGNKQSCHAAWFPTRTLARQQQQKQQSKQHAGILGAGELGSHGRRRQPETRRTVLVRVGSYCAVASTVLQHPGRSAAIRLERFDGAGRVQPTTVSFLFGRVSALVLLRTSTEHKGMPTCRLDAGVVCLDAAVAACSIVFFPGSAVTLDPSGIGKCRETLEVQAGWQAGMSGCP